MDKWLNVWMCEIITDSKSIMNSIVVELKVSAIYHISQSQEKVSVFSARVLL